MFKKELRTDNQSRWENLLSSARTNQFGVFPRKTEPKMRNLKTPSGTAFSDLEKAEAIAASLEEQFKPNPAANTECENLVYSRLRQYIEEKPYSVPHQITPEDIISDIRKLKNNKAPGMHEIPNLAVKHFPPLAVCVLTAIINATLRLAHFPTPWKEAKIIALPKPGKDLSVPSNYRPISLLPTLSKITEGVILKLVNSHLEENIIVPQQHGFREGTSTAHQLLRLIEEIKTKVGRRYCTVAAIFFDIEKSFRSRLDTRVGI